MASHLIEDGCIRNPNPRTRPEFEEKQLGGVRRRWGEAASSISDRLLDEDSALSIEAMDWN